MATYLISYDLGVPETHSDYEKIKKYIDTFPDWMKPLKSQWFVVSNTKNAEKILDEIIAITDSNDKILVLKVTNEDWASYNLGSVPNQWLKKNFN